MKKILLFTAAPSSLIFHCCLVLILLIQTKHIQAQNPYDTILCVKTISEADKFYSSFKLLTQAESFNTKYLGDSAGSYLANPDYIFMRKADGWQGFSQTDNMLFELDKAWVESFELKDISGDENPELIINWNGILYGARAETKFKYVQIWRADLSALILELKVYEKFSWLSSIDEFDLCKRTLSFSDKQIHISESICEGNEGIAPFSDKFSGSTYKIEGDLLIRIKP